MADFSSSLDNIDNNFMSFASFFFSSSSQTAASYIIRNPQPRRSSQSQPVRGRDEEQDDIVSADVEEVGSLIIKSLRP